MGIEYYFFAAFVFALGAVLIWMLAKGVAKGRAEQDLARAQQEKKLKMMNAEMTDLLEALENYIEESKAEMARMMEQVDGALKEAQKKEAPAGTPEDKGQGSEKNILGSRGELCAQAAALKKNGAAVAQIAERLKLSQGEVNLMLNIYGLSTSGKNGSLLTNG